jgi:hypothetical protein
VRLKEAVLLQPSESLCNESIIGVVNWRMCGELGPDHFGLANPVGRLFDYFPDGCHG